MKLEGEKEKKRHHLTKRCQSMRKKNQDWNKCISPNGKVERKVERQDREKKEGRRSTKRKGTSKKRRMINLKHIN